MKLLKRQFLEITRFIVYWDIRSKKSGISSVPLFLRKINMTIILSECIMKYNKIIGKRKDN